MKGKRKTFKGERDDRKRSIDDCVAEGHDECVNLSGVLNKYFCNDDPVCLEVRKVESLRNNEYKSKILVQLTSKN